MSVKFYGFLRTPFTNEIKAQEVFISSQVEELYRRLDYYLEHKGIGLVIGEVGSGKTTAVRSWVEKLNPNSRKVVYLSKVEKRARGFWRNLTRALGLKMVYQKDDLEASVISYIEGLTQKEKMEFILVIDEAHTISDQVFEEVRSLTNTEMDSKCPLSIILMGDPSIKGRLKMPELKSLSQRIRRPFYLTGLSCDEVKKYINHQLKLAGRNIPLFGDDTISLIFNYSKGIPRMINNICLDAIYEAGREKRDLIEERVIERLISEVEGL